MFLEYLEELAYFSYRTCEMPPFWIYLLSETSWVWTKKGSQQIAFLMGCFVLSSLQACLVLSASCRPLPVADSWHHSCISVVL